MKFLIASDIHGSAKYCQMLLKAFADEKCDKMLLLGDILYHGPRNDLPEEYAPKKVIEMLNRKSNRTILKPQQKHTNTRLRSMRTFRRKLKWVSCRERID